MQRFEGTIAVVSLGTLCPVGAAHRAVKFRRAQAGIDVRVTDPDSETRRALALLLERELVGLKSSLAVSVERHVTRPRFSRR